MKEILLASLESGLLGALVTLVVIGCFWPLITPNHAKKAETYVVLAGWVLVPFTFTFATAALLLNAYGL